MQSGRKAEQKGQGAIQHVKIDACSQSLGSCVAWSIVLRRYWKTLLAVLGGNLLYFIVLLPYLPPAARHRPGALDLGLVVDFWICLALYGLLAFTFRHRR